MWRWIYMRTRRVLPWRDGWSDSAWASTPSEGEDVWMLLDPHGRMGVQAAYLSGFRWGKRFRRLRRW